MLRFNQKRNHKAYFVATFLLLSMMLLSFNVFCQEYEIKGKVVDGNGKPVPGVNILIKGTPTGTVTNVEGNFSISVPLEESTLLFSFIGYKRTEQVITQEKGQAYELKVILVEDKPKFKKEKSSVEVIKLPSKEIL